MSALQEELDAFVLGDADWLTDDDSDVPPPEDPAGADRLLRAVRAYEVKMVETNDIANANINQITEWRDMKTGRLRHQVDRLTRSLETWMRHRHATSKGKVKTEKLPNGDLMVRARSRSLFVTDETAAVMWATVNAGEWIRFKAEIDKTAVREVIVIGDVAVDGPTIPEDGYEWRNAFTSDGEQVPGLLVLEPADFQSVRYQPKFSYKTTGGTP